MNFNFKKELEALNTNKFVEDDAEKTLKSVIDVLYNKQVCFNDIEWIEFKVLCTDWTCQLYSCYSTGHNVEFEIPSLKYRNGNYKYMIPVITAIEDKLKAEGFDCRDIVEFKQENITVKNLESELFELKSFKVVF